MNGKSVKRLRRYAALVTSEAIRTLPKESIGKEKTIFKRVLSKIKKVWYMTPSNKKASLVARIRNDQPSVEKA